MTTKRNIWIGLLILIAAVSIGFNLRHMTGSRQTSPQQVAANKEQADPPKEQYSCPMHPTIVQDHPGDCPICGMKLVKMDKPDSATVQDVADTSSKPRKILFYRNPMNPKETSPVPRKDEMGMDYIPVYEGETSSGGNVEGRAEIMIDPSRQQLIGLRTAPVELGDISAGWHTVGRVQIDPTKVGRINVKVAGYVEHIFVDFVGQSVKRGQPLFSFYSPELLAAQQEYLLALKTQRSLSGGNGSGTDSLLVTAARQKLKRWDVTDSQIQHLEETGAPVRALTVVSPLSGVVTVKNITEGSALNMGDIPYEVTDLSKVWMMADGYQMDAGRARVGMDAVIRLEAVPNRVFHGLVDFIDPTLDPASRTFKIRITIDNPNGELKPDMFADVQFQGSPHEALTIPADAIIPTGQENMVFVALGEGRFQPRAVTLGAKSGDRIEVLNGLNQGESVVTRANFLVDSESSLRAALAAAGGSR